MCGKLASTLKSIIRHNAVGRGSGYLTSETLSQQKGRKDDYGIRDGHRYTVLLVRAKLLVQACVSKSLLHLL